MVSIVVVLNHYQKLVSLQTVQALLHLLLVLHYYTSSYLFQQCMDYYDSYNFYKSTSCYLWIRSFTNNYYSSEKNVNKISKPFDLLIFYYPSNVFKMSSTIAQAGQSQY